MTGLRPSDFQSLLLDFQGCSTLDETLLRGYLLGDLPEEIARRVQQHVGRCHCCTLALQMVEVALSRTPAPMPVAIRERLAGELLDRLAGMSQPPGWSPLPGRLRGWVRRMFGRRPPPETDPSPGRGTE